MFETLPTDWRGRALAVALLVLALAVVYVVAAAPLLDLYTARETQIETRRALLAKLDAVAGELSGLRARLASLNATADSEKLTLPGASDAVASAALQGRFEALAAAKGVMIGSSESLAAQAQGAYHRIGLRLVLSAPYANLVNLLAALETARPPLIVAEFQIHSFRRGPDAAPTAALDAILEVYGFRADDTPAAVKP